jgi:hypothetical protein
MFDREERGEIHTTVLQVGNHMAHATSLGAQEPVKHVNRRPDRGSRTRLCRQEACNGIAKGSNGGIQVSSF